MIVTYRVPEEREVLTSSLSGRSSTSGYKWIATTLSKPSLSPFRFFFIRGFVSFSLLIFLYEGVNLRCH